MRVAGLDVLGEHQHPDLRMAALDLVGGASALVGEGRRHPDVDHDQVRAVSCDRRDQAPRISSRRRNLVPADRRTAAQVPRAAAPGPRRSRPAWQLRGQDRAFVRSTFDVQAAAVGRDPVVQPAQTAAELLDYTADAVVGDADDQVAVAPLRR